jgi:hypothetical protein
MAWLEDLLAAYHHAGDAVECPDCGGIGQRYVLDSNGDDIRWIDGDCPTCEGDGDIVYSDYDGRLARDTDNAEEGEHIAEAGLGFDYVAPDTFNEQPEGYFRFQLSCGGPSEELRFYVDYSGSMHHAEFWFLDWFDGSGLDVTADTRVGDLWRYLSVDEDPDHLRYLEGQS